MAQLIDIDKHIEDVLIHAESDVRMMKANSIAASHPSRETGLPGRRCLQIDERSIDLVQFLKEIEVCKPVGILVKTTCPIRPILDL